jgi:uncharacterized membrane protein
MNLQDIASASALIKTELAPLAEKIGQGAEYTFSLFVRQVYVNALTELLLWIPGIILLYIAKRFLDCKSISNDLRFVVILFCTVLGLLFVLVPLATLIGVLVNPDYQAIKLIIETIKVK